MEVALVPVLEGVEGTPADVAHADAFLRALELRGLSPRTSRAYAMDAVGLLRRRAGAP